MSYTIRYNRATNHIDGIGVRSTGGGNDMGDRVSYYALNACGALTRSGSRMAIGKSFDSLADALDHARKVGGRNLCKSCEKAAIAQLAAEAEKVEQAANSEESAYLPALPGDIDPNAPHVMFGFFECRTCGERSDVAAGNDRGVVETDWDARHKAATGHRKFYLYSVTRQTSQVW